MRAAGERFLFHLLALVACAWILVPIYLLAISAFGGEPVINAWPKSLVPEAFDPTTMRFSFGVQGYGPRSSTASWWRS